MTARDPNVPSRDDRGLSSRDVSDEGPAVSARKLGFVYDRSETAALSGLDLTLPRGTLTAVVGASGAGKSTLCLTMNGLAPKFARGRLEGELTVLGRQMGDVPVHEMVSSVGMVLQDFEAQLFSTSAELEVAFGLENLGVDRAQMRDLVASSLRDVGLAGFEKRDPSTLSGGEKQRLALAAVLAMRPELLVMDEPTSDLDPQGCKDVLGIVKGKAGQGRSILLVDHETDELLQADHVLMLDRGRRALSGSSENVFRQLGHLEAAGVRPPQLAQLSELLKLDSMPRDVSAAQEEITRLGLTADNSRCRALPIPERAKGGAPVVLKAQNVSYSYVDGDSAVKDACVEIREGEFVAIVGVNGSGKTTLVKHFNGLLLPRTGFVEVAGVDTRETLLSAISQRVGYVFQNPDHQIFSETVSDELAFGPKNAGSDPGDIRKRSGRALAAVQMQDYEGSDPFALTKGQRQRVALASVLVMEPSVIVMDEPTTGLDYMQQKHVMDLLCELNLRGHTIIIITHSLWLASQYARRTIVMHEGRVAADGPTRHVMCAGEGLEKWSLVSPPAIALARRLGVPALTPRELSFCLGGDIEISL